MSAVSHETTFFKKVDIKVPRECNVIGSWKDFLFTNRVYRYLKDLHFYIAVLSV